MVFGKSVPTFGCLSNAPAVAIVMVTMVIAVSHSSMTSSSHESSVHAHQAWLNPCAESRPDLIGLDETSHVADLPTSPTATSIALRVDVTLQTVREIQAQLLAYYNGNYRHLYDSNSEHTFSSVEQILVPEETNVDTVVIALYRSLARIASVLFRMRLSLRRHGHRFSRRKFTDLLGVLEYGGVVNGRMNNGGIYHIMCDIYKLVSTTGSDVSQLTANTDDVTYEHPKTARQLHDKFFQTFTSIESVINELQQHLLLVIARGGL